MGYVVGRAMEYCFESTTAFASSSAAALSHNLDNTS